MNSFNYLLIKLQQITKNKYLYEKLFKNIFPEINIKHIRATLSVACCSTATLSTKNIFPEIKKYIKKYIKKDFINQRIKQEFIIEKNLFHLKN